MSRDLLQLADHLFDESDVLAVTPSLDQVEDSRPAHEPMKRRVALVKDAPQMMERVIVATVAESRGAPGEMQWSKHRPTVHREQSALRLGKHRLKIRLYATQRRGQRGHELAGEPVLRLATVARQAPPVDTGRRRGRPIAQVGRCPREVNEGLREHPDSPLLTKALDRPGQESPPCDEVPRLLRRDPEV